MYIYVIEHLSDYAAILCYKYLLKDHDLSFWRIWQRSITQKFCVLQTPCENCCVVELESGQKALAKPPLSPYDRPYLNPAYLKTLMSTFVKPSLWLWVVWPFLNTAHLTLPSSRPITRQWSLSNPDVCSMRYVEVSIRLLKSSHWKLEACELVSVQKVFWGKYLRLKLGAFLLVLLPRHFFCMYSISLATAKSSLSTWRELKHKQLGVNHLV